jgi:hypothetical protein
MLGNYEKSSGGRGGSQALPTVRPEYYFKKYIDKPTMHRELRTRRITVGLKGYVTL